jgi:hypothetical protein
MRNEGKIPLMLPYISGGLVNYMRGYLPSYSPTSEAVAVIPKRPLRALAALPA